MSSYISTNHVTREELENYLRSECPRLYTNYLQNRELFFATRHDIPSHEFQIAASIDILYWEYFTKDHAHLFEKQS